jgi:predicted amidophosphoribosyltransferase
MRETQTQVGLDFVSRQANVGGAFTVEDSATVAGQVIILVDDVCTTGATLDACAKALLASGAFRVEGVTLARQI